MKWKLNKFTMNENVYVKDKSTRKENTMKSKTYKKQKKLIDIFDESAILDENVDEFLFGQDDDTIISGVNQVEDETYD